MAAPKSRIEDLFAPSEVEATVLAIALSDNEALLFLIDRLEEDHFVLSEHATLWRAIRSVFEERGAVDRVTVIEEMVSSPSRYRVKNPGALVAEIAGQWFSGLMVEQYFDLLDEARRKRHLAAALLRARDALAHGERSLPDVVEMMRSACDRVDGDRSGARLAWEVAQEIEASGRWLGVESEVFWSGYRRLDALTNGWRPGDLVVIAARTSHGKTAIGCSIAMNVAESQRTVCFFSLEMPPDQIVDRFLSRMTGIPLAAIRRGKLGDEDLGKIRSAMDRLKGMPLYLDAAKDPRVSRIRSQARAVRRGDSALVVVDYLQLLWPRGRHETRQAEVAEITRDLKRMAIEEKVVVIALAQLNREAEKAADEGGRPRLGHLRESGAIEQDADQVIFLWRKPGLDTSANHRVVIPIEVIVAKSRNGPTGVVELDFHAPTVSFPPHAH